MLLKIAVKSLQMTSKSSPSAGMVGRSSVDVSIDAKELPATLNAASAGFCSLSLCNVVSCSRFRKLSLTCISMDLVLMLDSVGKSE